MKWIKIIVLFLALIAITKYTPQFQDKGGLIFIDFPLMILWGGFAGMLAIPDILGVKWGSKEWWIHANRYRPRGMKESLRFAVICLVCYLTLFQIRFGTFVFLDALF